MCIGRYCCEQVVHSYGHGGAGVTLHWGCAGDTVRLVQQCLGMSPQSKMWMGLVVGSIDLWYLVI